jgi:hypothetical protein
LSSFSFQPTSVALNHETLAAGDLVMSYDPMTGEAKPEPIEAVHIHNDDNLLDVTLSKTSDTNADHDSPSSPSEKTLSESSKKESSCQTNETVHTTTEHPFLTTDRSFVDAEDLHLEEQVIESDGSIGTVLAVMVVPGLGIRYNLTVKDLHTFMVGDGQWVVHNTNCGGINPDYAAESTDIRTRGTGAGGNNGKGGAYGVQEGSDIAVAHATGEPGLRNPGIKYNPSHPYKGVCGETQCVYQALDLLEQGEWKQGMPIDIYYSQYENARSCLGCKIAANHLAEQAQATVRLIRDDGKVMYTAP